MRLCSKTAWIALFAMLVVCTAQPAWTQEQNPPPAAHKDKAAKDKAAKDKADADKDDADDDDEPVKLLTMKDIIKMRRSKTTPDQIVEKATEQGVEFEVTPVVERQLRRMGFKPDQIQALKEAHGPQTKKEKPGPIVPGKWLKTSDAQRDHTREQVAKICKMAAADLEPVEAKHFTLWAAKDIQGTFLPDIKKLEKLLETHSGADPLGAGQAVGPHRAHQAPL